jgi:hypothetical protein
VTVQVAPTESVLKQLCVTEYPVPVALIVGVLKSIEPLFVSCTVPVVVVLVAIEPRARALVLTVNPLPGNAEVGTLKAEVYRATPLV